MSVTKIIDYIEYKNSNDLLLVLQNIVDTMNEFAEKETDEKDRIINIHSHVSSHFSDND